MGADTAILGPAGTDTAAPAAASARSGAPLLEPTPGGPAEGFARRLGGAHPVVVFLTAILGGYALLVGVTIALGLLVTRVLLDIEAIVSFDRSVAEWFVRQRTPFLVDLSWVGSTLSGGIVIPVLVGVLLVLFLAYRHWRLAAFSLFVICVESGTYRGTTLVVHRDRPDVERLETLPVDASFPSGHVAASTALLGGLAILLASRVEHRAAKLALWLLAAAFPVFQAWSRMLRGMHNATDVVAGASMGAAALAITVFACRAAGAAADRRDATKSQGTSQQEGSAS